MKYATIAYYTAIMITYVRYQIPADSIVGSNETTLAYALGIRHYVALTIAFHLALQDVRYIDYERCHSSVPLLSPAII